VVNLWQYCENLLSYYYLLFLNTFIEQPDLGTLFNLVEKYPFLFDKQNKHFKNARMQEQAWNEIGRTLSTQGIERQVYVVFFYNI
jgi:hypothetical protein